MSIPVILSGHRRSHSGSVTGKTYRERQTESPVFLFRMSVYANSVVGHRWTSPVSIPVISSGHRTCRSCKTYEVHHCLVSLVVKASDSGVEDPGFEFRLRRDFPGSSHTSDLKIGTPVATLPGAWHYRVSAGTGWPGVSIL